MKTKSKTYQSIYNDIDAVLGDIDEHQLQRALAYLQARYCVLHYCSGPRMPIDLWSSAKLPLAVRRVVRKHKEAIAERMHQGATEVCPNPSLHQRFWVYDIGRERDVCTVCQQIEPSLEPVSHDVVLSSTCEEVSNAH